MAKRETPDILSDILETEAGSRETGDNVRMNYYLPKPLVARVREFGKRRHWPASYIVAEAIREYLDKHEDG
jgi:hypothetical protein